MLYHTVLLRKSDEKRENNQYNLRVHVCNVLLLLLLLLLLLSLLCFAFMCVVGVLLVEATTNKHLTALCVLLSDALCVCCVRFVCCAWCVRVLCVCCVRVKQNSKLQQRVSCLCATLNTVLPAPDGPITAVTRPGRTRPDTPDKTTFLSRELRVKLSCV